MIKDEFAIISNNCWGAEVYKHFCICYNTPFVGLFIPPMCFVKLCKNVTHYLKKDLKFIKTSKYEVYSKIIAEQNYPLAILEDVEIHFLHYKDKYEALEKWNRRVNRMPKDQNKWRIKGCDREITDRSDFAKKWNEITHSKVFFSAKFNTDIDDLIWIKGQKESNEVVDGMTLFPVSSNYLDIPFWLESGVIRNRICQDNSKG